MFRGLGLALVVLVLSAGFAGPVFAQEPSDLKVTLATDKQVYAPGEPVNFTLTVTNTGSQEATLTFRSGQEVDYIVSQGGNELWKWSIGRFFTQAVKMIPIAAGETRTYQDQWLQVSNSSQTISNGEYTAVGIITAGPGLQSNTVTFSIGSEQPGQPSPTPTPGPGGQVLPQTGGPGSGIFLLIAGVLGVGTVFLGVVARRRA